MRNERKANGKCIHCGKPLSKYSTVYCIDCRIKNDRKNHKHCSIPRSERVENGMCYICGSSIDSGRLCDICKSKVIKNLEKAVASPKYKTLSDNIRRQNKLIFYNGRNSQCTH